MIEIPGRIPIYIHGWFWLTAGLIGFLNGGDLITGFIWVGIIFVSVLFHEFGHALMALVFKHDPVIRLVAFGGVTEYEKGPKLKYWQHFLITLNGPLFGFLLFLFASFLLTFDWTAYPVWHLALRLTQFANLFWTILNLFPVQPLDGGHLLRIVLEACFGIKGFRASLLAGSIFAGLVALGFFLMGGFLIGAIFFLFAYYSFENWRKNKKTKAEDRDEDLMKQLVAGEECLRRGEFSAAEKEFTAALEKSPDNSVAHQYMAFVKLKMGHKEDAYNLLKQIGDDLADNMQVLLHELAADFKDWDLVAKLSTDCYQYEQSASVALRNARAFASLKKPKEAGGWLETAALDGAIDLEKILNEEPFQAIRHDPDFEHFIR